MKTILFAVALIFSAPSFGQYSNATLNFNNVSALLTDGGVLFQNAQVSTAAYEVGGFNVHSIFSSAFWFAAEDSIGGLHMSATGYTPSEDLFPGPIANQNEYGSTDYLNDYSSSIWFMGSYLVNDHIQNYDQPGYVADPTILNWPGNGNTSIGVAEQLAPYVDMNNNGLYEPMLGDYPNIRGDAAMYIIMNDGAQIHSNSGASSLGVEVHLMVYQYATMEYKNDATLINARVFNRGGIDYSDFKCTFLVDADLGNYLDDYYGCDPSRNAMFTYNGDGLDEDVGGLLGYGTNPPAIGVMSLSNPISQAGQYTSVAAAVYSDPVTAADYWNYMNGKWKDGSDWMYGGAGYAGSPGVTTNFTDFIYDGNPSISSEWSENSYDLASGQNVPGDRRMFMNIESLPLLVGDVNCYDFAIVYARNFTNSNLENVDLLKNQLDDMQIFYDTMNFTCQQVVLSTEELFMNNQFVIQPNPSNGTFTIKAENQQGEFEISISDMTGREVMHKRVLNTNDHIIDLKEEPGIYLVTLSNKGMSATKRLIIQ